MSDVNWKEMYEKLEKEHEALKESASELAKDKRALNERNDVLVSMLDQLLSKWEIQNDEIIMMRQEIDDLNMLR